MVEYQLYIIPAIVSAIIGFLSYVVPYVWPEEWTDFIMCIRRDDPYDFVGINLIISQFLNYDDWKRLTAKKRLKRIFKRKMADIERDKEKRWEELKNNSISIPIKQAITGFERALKPNNSANISDENLEDKSLVSKNYLDDAIKNMDKKEIKKVLNEYREIYGKHKNARIWILLEEKFHLIFQKVEYLH
jgi:hypothetical protein